MTPLPLCGTCDVCCTALAVMELGKPYHTRCEHQNGKGCAIYAHRPFSCADYECVWLMANAPLELRPDNLGVMFNHREEDECIEMFIMKEISFETFVKALQLAHDACAVLKCTMVRVIPRTAVLAVGFYAKNPYPQRGEAFGKQDFLVMEDLPAGPTAFYVGPGKGSFFIGDEDLIARLESYA